MFIHTTLSRVALGVALATLTPVAASASTLFFDLRSGTGTGGNDGSGNYRTFSATDGSTTVNVRATAWTAKPVNGGYQIARSSLGQYSHGLGVTAPGSQANGGDGSGSNNLHTIDNKGSVDFVLFQFDQIVEADTASLTRYAIGSGTADRDATIGFGTTNIGYTSGAGFASWFTNQINLPGEQMTNLYFSDGLNAVDINPGDYRGNLLLVAASFDNLDYSSTYSRRSGYKYYGLDGFKFSGLTVNTAAVPEPGSWAMMISGFGIVGAAMRRRRTLALA